MTSNGDIDAPPAVITAHAGRYFRWTCYIIALAMVVMGLWFGYDGFVQWPKENQAWIDKEREAAIKNNLDPDKVDTEKLPHPGFDVPLQRILFFALPPLGVIFLIRWLYISRGEYRLEDDTLHIPGHPPVPLDAVTEIDKHLWDRKGIAYISYELADGTRGTVKLDDFIYERDPTDKIYDRIIEVVAPEAEAEEKQQETSS